MVTLRHKDDPKFLHNFKFGKKMKNEREENVYISPDLTRREREAVDVKRKRIWEKKEKVNALKIRISA